MLQICDLRLSSSHTLRGRSCPCQLSARNPFIIFFLHESFRVYHSVAGIQASILIAAAHRPKRLACFPAATGANACGGLAWTGVCAGHIKLQISTRSFYPQRAAVARLQRGHLPSTRSPLSPKTHANATPDIKHIPLCLMTVTVTDVKPPPQ